MPRNSRRLHDSLISVAHRACDAGHLDLAAELLRLSEEVMPIEQDPRKRQHDMWVLTAAHERLWHLRHNGGQGAD